MSSPDEIFKLTEERMKKALDVTRAEEILDDVAAERCAGGEAHGPSLPSMASCTCAYRRG